MLRARVIPILLLDGRGLFKTVRFQKPRYIGDPVNAVRIFNEKEVDELIVVDVNASTSRRGPNHQLVEEIATEAFMPVCYGGGVHSIDEMRRIFALGVEKVAVNAAAGDHKMLAAAAEVFGRQSVVVSVDVRRRRFNRREQVVVDRARRAVDDDPVGYCRRAVASGAGELLVTSVDREGTRTGLDIGLITRVAAAVDVPVVAHGGVGSIDDIRDGLAAGASAVACGSLFVLHGPHHAVLISYLDEAERLSLG